ncbi:MAG: hypothetical protein M1840_003740 [Geoglossum simile]|nr:MAG: hypothetical protein M1840_003740 [Geoglossum simile]
MAESRPALNLDPSSGVSSLAQREEIRRVLAENWIGEQRCLTGSLNEFKYWAPGEVRALFQLLPPLAERKLYPLGPEFRTIPTGLQRWKGLAGKVALLGLADSLVLLGFPFLLLANKDDREKAMGGLKTMHVDVISSSFFVKPSLELMQQAVESGKALCVNKWGQFRLLDSGYAAISHAWCETMGLEYHDEKTEQDSRGLNMHHFFHIIEQACKSGFEWFWFDLLAIPKGSDDPTADKTLRELKTKIINSLYDVYRNAGVVVILDALTMQIRSGNHLEIAVILSCGRWLTRIWTYQEVKIARKTLIVTATHVVDFSEMVETLKQQEKVDFWRWNQLYLTFRRLLHTDQGISLPDIALSCQNRNTCNEIDYARGFFALLGLKWQTGWSYDDGILEILRSQPRHAGRIANMHGIRGLPSPYSWAPKYLARLEGKISDDYHCQPFGLLGYWYTVPVKEVKKVGATDDNTPLIMLAVLDKDGVEVEIQTSLPQRSWTDQVEEWVKKAVPSGQARLLCQDNPVMAGGEPNAHVMLLATQTPGGTDALEFDGTAKIAGSAVLNYGGVEGTKLKWWLS